MGLLECRLIVQFAQHLWLEQPNNNTVWLNVYMWNIKTKITVNVNIFIIVLMNCVSPSFTLSKMYKLDVKNTKLSSLNKFNKVIWEGCAKISSTF